MNNDHGIFDERYFEEQAPQELPQQPTGTTTIDTTIGPVIIH